MTPAIRHVRRAARLLPATLASLVSLFALAPAETAVNRLLHRPPHATTPFVPVAGPHGTPVRHAFHDERALWLSRHAFRRHAPDEETQAACTVETCFDPESFEPSGGDPPPPEASGGLPAADGNDGAEPPATPSSDPVQVAALDSFTPDHGARHAQGGGAGGAGGDEGGGPESDDPPIDYVLLPGSGTPGGSGTGPAGAGGAGGNPSDGNPEGGGERGPTNGSAGGSGAGGSGGGGGVPGTGPIGGPDGEGGDGNDEGDIESLALRVEPASGAVDVPAPATAPLLAAALAWLALRGRRVRPH